MPKLTKGDPTSKTTTKRLARVDFLGSLFLGSLILSLLLPLEIGGIKVPWNHPLIPSLFGLAVILIGLFIATEKWWATEPILPLELFHRRDSVVTFIIMGLQVAAQIGVRVGLSATIEIILMPRCSVDVFRAVVLPSNQESVKHRGRCSSLPSCSR